MARSRPHTLTQRGAAFLTSGAVLLCAGVLLGQRDLTRVGVLVLGLLGFCHAVARLRPLRLDATRLVSPARIGVDESARVSISMRNVGDRRTSLAVGEEMVDPALGDRPRFTIPPVASGQVSEVEYAIRPHLRGHHALGPLRVWSRDPFGLTSVETVTEGVGAVLVTPRIHPLVSARSLGGGVGSEGSIPHQVALHGEDDQSIRQYREGDDLRRIHWPATARTGELMVRQEDRPARRRAVILLDARASGHSGHGATSSFEWFVTMAASVMAHTLDLGYAVHLLTPDLTSDAGVRNDEDVDAMLETLARIRCGPDDGFRAVLHGAHAFTGSAGLLVALTTGLDDDTARALSSLRQHGATAIGLVHLPRSGEVRGAPLAGRTLATLSSSGWLTRGVDGLEPPAKVWSDLTGASLVGAPG